VSDWKRVTRGISYDQAPAEFKAEILRHVELYNLGDILSDAVICIQSDSEKPKKGLFGSTETNLVVAVLTPRWLLWAVSGNKTPVTATSALLNDVLIQDYAATPYARMVPDSGIQVNGKFTDVAESSSAFIGLENNAAGQRFKELAIAAVRNAKK
jgi:hypothetical protein